MGQLGKNKNQFCTFFKTKVEKWCVLWGSAVWCGGVGCGGVGWEEGSAQKWGFVVWVVADIWVGWGTC